MTDQDKPPFEIPQYKPDPKPPEPLTEQKVDFAYTIFWTKMTATWDEVKRHAIYESVNTLIASLDFDKNYFERKFHVEGLDDLDHAGASLLALQKVLEARGKVD